MRHLRYFVAVAEAQNVLRAATQKLHVSQPAVSRQIRDLEDELGVQLFERTGKSVRLSEPGRVFLKAVREVLERVDEAVKETRAVAGADETEQHVGYSPTTTRASTSSSARTNATDSISVVCRPNELFPSPMCECKRHKATISDAYNVNMASTVSRNAR